jgi:hypothetical protein
MSNIVPPLPERLEPKITNRALMTNVRGYFYPLYNGNETFRSLLKSVDNKTSVTLNRYFDRKVAVDMIVTAATKAEDKVTEDAKAGEIYKCLVHIMSKHGVKLKLRRAEYRRIEQQDETQPVKQAAD